MRFLYALEILFDILKDVMQDDVIANGIYDNEIFYLIGKLDNWI